MPGILAEIHDIYGDKSFYEILNIQKKATKNEIRKAYYQLSLKVHPDRAPADQLDQATKQFQSLGKIYEILSDDGRRALYDEEGTVDDEYSVASDDRNWNEYWRLLFPRVKLDDIESFTKKYKGSKEELDTLKQAYVDCEGKMDDIIDNVLCATVDDEPRFRTILEDLIAKGKLSAFDAFTNERTSKREARKKKAAAEEKEAEKAKKKIMKNGDGKKDLSALILANQKTRGQQSDAFFSYMEQKYGGADADEGGDDSEAEDEEEEIEEDEESDSSEQSPPTKKGSKSRKRSSSKSSTGKSPSPAKKAKLTANAKKPAAKKQVAVTSSKAAASKAKASKTSAAGKSPKKSKKSK